MYELIFQKCLFILKYSLYFPIFSRLDLDNLQGLCKKEWVGTSLMTDIEKNQDFSNLLDC